MATGMHTTSSRASRSLVGVVLALATGVGAACSSSPSKPSPAVEQAVLESYRQSWIDVAGAGDPINPDDPRLRAHRAGQALDVIVAVMREYKSKGLVYRGEVELHPKIVEFSGDKAKIRDCTFDHTEAVDPSTNTVVKTAAIHPIWTNTTMEKRNGTWFTVTFSPENQQCTPAPGT